VNIDRETEQRRLRKERDPLNRQIARLVAKPYSAFIACMVCSATNDANFREFLNIANLLFDGGLLVRQTARPDEPALPVVRRADTETPGRE
jgi:hypothetical protein